MLTMTPAVEPAMMVETKALRFLNRALPIMVSAMNVGATFCLLVATNPADIKIKASEFI